MWKVLTVVVAVGAAAAAAAAADKQAVRVKTNHSQSVVTR